jgi:D-glycero-D-manno-heptose 1,7-bisphosphate phosphatase
LRKASAGNRRVTEGKYYGWGEFAATQRSILSALSVEGAKIDAIYACPHHPHGKGAFVHPDHPWRKPNPGMLLRAGADLNLDLRKSWLVGDKISDIAAAKRAYLRGALLLLNARWTGFR